MEFNKENSVMVSVIMSVYNAEKYLDLAIESILNQSFRDFEFIIIEDCSTDNSLEILKNYAEKDSRIKIIQKTENKRMKGFIENLNIGLKEAKGKYITRMDADDISHPSRFEKQVAFLESHSDIFMVGSSINFINEKGEITGKLPALEADHEIKKQMPIKISMFHPVIMFRNEKEVRYRENIFYCEDYDLYLRLMLEGKKFHNFSEALLDYRLLNSSISRKDSKFIKFLFIEKMKCFYYERKEKGYDSYKNFVPDNFLNILKTEFPSSEKDLLFSIKVSVKYRYKEEFDILVKKIQKQYPETKILLYKILNSLPSVISKIYFKFLSK